MLCEEQRYFVSIFCCMSVKMKLKLITCFLKGFLIKYLISSDPFDCKYII